MTKTLIAGTCHVKTFERRELVKLWARVNLHLNPGCDILLVDSASPIRPAEFLSGMPVRVVRFEEDFGHRSAASRDVPACFSEAVSGGYDNFAFIESDLLFAWPVARVFERMRKAGVKAAAPMDSVYQFIEGALMFFDVAYLRDTDFPARCACDETRDTQLPEKIFEALLGDDLWILPYRGLRNDQGRLTWKNFEASFPQGGPDYLTHCSDFGLYHKFLRHNGVTLP